MRNWQEMFVLITERLTTVALLRNSKRAIELVDQKTAEKNSLWETMLDAKHVT